MAQFSLEDKVVLITGGASGIGFCCAKELLKHRIRGVTIADINEQLGQESNGKLMQEYGNKCIFIKTDTTNYNSFREAFSKTVDTFGNIDILLNCAGICNDSIWEKEIAVNINGTINGHLLGLDEYILKHRSGNEGAIINFSSIRGIEPGSDRPIYAASKFFINGLTLGWASKDHYDRTKIKVIAVAPGATSTPMIAHLENSNLGPAYEEIRKKQAARAPLPRQTAEECAKSTVEILKVAKSGTIWIAEAGDKMEYKLLSRPIIERSQ